MAELADDVLKEIEDTIMVFDRVGDNKIAVQDIVNALRALEMNPGSNEWDEVINGYQRQGVDRININEFAVIYEEESKKTRASQLELVEGLKSIDPGQGKQGLVNAATLKRYMSLFGDTVTDEQADIIMAPALDGKGNNVIIDDIVKLVMGRL